MTNLSTSKFNYYNHLWKDRNHSFLKPFRPYHVFKLIVGYQDILQNEFDRKKYLENLLCKRLLIIILLSLKVWGTMYGNENIKIDLLFNQIYVDNPIKAVTTRFIKIATNKMYYLIFCIAWTPEGRCLIISALSNESTL
ncbi:pre-mRNA 3' end processing protein WDR33 [Vespula squamosa]|uniref:Pre-mRNA 3' end processing protein WDR33 n=1 Tax=Vespula squamosa TaxID=30214 RepID=A0ABD2AHE7_VESSQ